MKVLDLLTEIEEILETSSGVPLSKGKVIVDQAEILDIVREIRDELPEEIQQAQWVKDERERILDDAKVEYDNLIKVAKAKADSLVENDDITIRAKNRAEDIMRVTEQNVKDLKLSTFAYIDDILLSLQERMDDLNNSYVARMFNDVQDLFEKVNITINSNRLEVKELSDKTIDDEN